MGAVVDVPLHHSYAAAEHAAQRCFGLPLVHLCCRLFQRFRNFGSSEMAIASSMFHMVSNKGTSGKIRTNAEKERERQRQRERARERERERERETGEMCPIAFLSLPSYPSRRLAPRP